jgi:hypothetical protein
VFKSQEGEILRKLGFGLLLLSLLMFACAQEEVAEKGDDLTLVTDINITDLPYVGPVSVKQTQMISGEIMRSQISTSINIAGEAQEIMSIFIINLNEGKVYFVNDRDSNYVGMSFAEFDKMLEAANPMDDTAGATLELTKDQVHRNQEEAKPIDPYGPCVPVDFDLVLSGSGENAGYQSGMQGKMWLSKGMENSNLYIEFKQQAMNKLQNSITGNAAFFGIPAAVNLSPEWFDRINQAIDGVPVEAEFKITMPVKNDTITYGITMALEDYSTANIDKSLLAVPSGYKEVTFSEFRMY